MIGAYFRDVEDHFFSNKMKVWVDRSLILHLHFYSRQDRIEPFPRTNSSSLLRITSLFLEMDITNFVKSDENSRRRMLADSLVQLFSLDEVIRIEQANNEVTISPELFLKVCFAKDFKLKTKGLGFKQISGRRSFRFGYVVSFEMLIEIKGIEKKQVRLDFEVEDVCVFVPKFVERRGESLFAIVFLQHEIIYDIETGNYSEINLNISKLENIWWY